MPLDKDKVRATKRKRYAENKENILANNKKWRDKNIEYHREKSKQYARANREVLLPKKREYYAENKDRLNLGRRLRKFGLALEEFRALEAEQGWACLLCGAEDHLVIDHCHKTGKVRALLCSPCNTAFGLLKEDPIRIMKLHDYAIQAGIMSAQAKQKAAGMQPAGTGQAPQ